MGTNHNQPDEAIDRTLAALRDAAPREAMEARILARLSEQTPAPLSVWRRLTSGPQMEGAWLRGALTGALIATAACALAFCFVRTPRPTASQTATDAIPQHAPTVTPVALNAGAPCAGQTPHSGSAWTAGAAASARVPQPSSGLMRDEWEEKSSRSPHLVPASFAPSHPAPPAPLTAQERALLQFVRTATPAQLAALSPAAQERADAKRQADFDKFFAPSAEIRAIDDAQQKALGISDNAPAPPTSSKEGQL